MGADGDADFTRMGADGDADGDAEEDADFTRMGDADFRGLRTCSIKQ
jgi:hypothetical protein